MSREAAIDRATEHFDTGGFLADLEPRIAIQTVSQEKDRGNELRRYLTDSMIPLLEGLGFRSRILDNPVEGYGPFLISERHEENGLPTLLTYGHGDVVRGYDDQWREGLSPWRIAVEGDRWYGRGTADNKGQHAINIAALAHVLQTRGKLGFNAKIIIEMGEETGSPGLRRICEQEKDALKADVLIASDGPRLAPGRPTIFLGSRGTMNFNLTVELREGAHHSGNWGGLLANPGTILANAIATVVDKRGRILLDALRPTPIPNSVRQALSTIVPGEGENAPAIDQDWGEPGLTPAERVFGWNSFEVLAFTTGNPNAPANAIPARAWAQCQMRFVVGSRWKEFLPELQMHFDRNGFGMVKVTPARAEQMAATRLDPDDPWVRWAVDSIRRTTGGVPDILPNLGGSLPNEVFADLLGLPTVWVPHSYASCSQHAPNEHALAPIVREGLQIMTGLFWDLGESGNPAAGEKRG